MPRMALVAIGLALALGGCSYIRTTPPEHRRPTAGPRNPTKAERRDARFWRKTVAGKEAPARLVATDGSTCLVDSDKFERVKVGDGVWCTWVERS